MGLKNGGATCYMNAVFQQLFMQPSIRALVLGAREEPPTAREDSPFFQLQARSLSPSSSPASVVQCMGLIGAPVQLPQHRVCCPMSSHHIVSVLSCL